MISILLPAFKSSKLLKEVFWPSFVNNTSSEEHEVILYDNGGNEEFIQDIGADNLTIIGKGTNDGLNVGLNACAKVANGDYFYLCHTDMYLLRGWDSTLLKEAKNLPPTSYLMCSRSIEPHPSHIPSQLIENFGDSIETFNPAGIEKYWYARQFTNVIKTNARMPFFMHKKLWTKIGGVDENLFSYCTDDDIIQQCYDVGVRRFWMCYNSGVYHLQGKSNAQQTVDRDSKKPYEYFIQKWKKKYPDVHHPGQYHPQLIPFETRVK